MIKLSTGMRESLAITGSLKATLDGGLVRMYSGSVPANADAALGGAVLLCEISVGGDGTPVSFEATAPLGVLAKSVSENWTGNNLGSGTPSFFRYVLDGDAGDSSATAVRFQGTAGALGSDMFIADLPLVADEPLSFSLFRLAIPEQ
jgi:hypothetical protein